ncbi:transcription factor RFX4 [Trichonephila inaurata madagascariensis]|uniref:Transcription factor RFX4 n=1 Tax=Trichonephila inaurata madagascariensis TaxID=2747483 RepID=A0A8X7CPC9_9ARAC|nr:transcription factor RFX4 [Trichonephila inaurata madagascariensis]
MCGVSYFAFQLVGELGRNITLHPNYQSLSNNAETDSMESFSVHLNPNYAPCSSESPTANYEETPSGQTINQVFYKDVLERLRKRVICMTPDIADKWMIHHDNGPCYTALSITESLTSKVSTPVLTRVIAEDHGIQQLDMKIKLIIINKQLRILLTFLSNNPKAAACLSSERFGDCSMDALTFSGVVTVRGWPGDFFFSAEPVALSQDDTVPTQPTQHSGYDDSYNRPEDNSAEQSGPSSIMYTASGAIYQSYTFVTHDAGTPDTTPPLPSDKKVHHLTVRMDGTLYCDG